MLSTNSLFAFVCQDICKRSRFWWRRLIVTWPLTANTPTYDFTNAALFPSLKEIAVEEIQRFTLIIAAGPPLQEVRLMPIFDSEGIIEMTLNTTLAQPARYTIDPLTYSKLRIDPPDLNYTAYIVGWAMPNPAADSVNDVVPLIPPWGHNAIVEGMKAKIFEFAYGPESGKATGARELYEAAILDLLSKKQFDPTYILQLNVKEHAIRST